MNTKTNTRNLQTLDLECGAEDIGLFATDVREGFVQFLDLTKDSLGEIRCRCEGLGFRSLSCWSVVRRVWGFRVGR